MLEECSVHWNSPRIMILEDEGIIALDIQTKLEHMGFPVVAIVASASEAFRAIEQDRPELILVDVRIRGVRSERYAGGFAMTTEEWIIEVALSRCQSALQEPEMQHFETLSGSSRLQCISAARIIGINGQSAFALDIFPQARRLGSL
jgi:CheY-like chemotaxis protein